MNSYELIGLTVSWMILVIGILCWGITASKGNWVLKIISSLLVLVLTLGIIFAFRELQGTPKIISLRQTENLLLRSYMIKEPKKDYPGQIWLWVTPKKGGTEPLSVEIPYSKKMHKQLTENKGLKQGRAQKFKKGKPGSNGNDKDKQNPDYELEDFVPEINKDAEGEPEAPESDTPVPHPKKPNIIS
jgi:hypothetical protein